MSETILSINYFGAKFYTNGIWFFVTINASRQFLLVFLPSLEYRPSAEPCICQLSTAYRRNYGFSLLDVETLSINCFFASIELVIVCLYACAVFVVGSGQSCGTRPAQSAVRSAP